ncbi:bacterial bifunctional deaminase-reductase [Gonapodya prolifera JEL478]|uniref:2,5-diamino-6-ribosylamino-4(3H)-pyrimidinone 5'-phosphate reductase n=1 Tax=Gonapodya prolifera (strain JEL478) TaxID=1344416 RepID=A0A139AUX3_GONPJ|nr:bacterial bifunctional deaminase-reductase [Gonapodya prolifera JEL478]|eukprot:KXS20499.1 bacterial bifunctional deaminase-reductase [Gonapodya prolifera JEL478]
MNSPHAPHAAIALLAHRIPFVSPNPIPSPPSQESLNPTLPFVTVTYAQSLDGFIALPDRRPLTISCSESFAMTHVMRTMHDAILVGVGTVLGDDPRLTSREDILGVEGVAAVKRARGEPDGAGLHHPRPVVVDSTLTKFPYQTSRLMGHPRGKPIVLTTTRYSQERRTTLESLGVEVVVCADSRDGADGDTAQVDLSDGFCKLHAHFGIRTIMVEGGARIIGSLLRRRKSSTDKSEQLVAPQLVVVTVAPTFVGNGVKVIELTGESKVVGGSEGLVQLADVEYRQFGRDMVVVAGVKMS